MLLSLLCNFVELFLRELGEITLFLYEMLI
jgi:hypothetical protein